MLWIPAELEKGHRDRLLAMAPEFAEFLLATRDAERTGKVFKPLGRNGSTTLKAARVGTVVRRIGKAADVKVYTYRKSEKVKYASAQDLRRSFGERWAVKVMPQTLMELMRHESIETTMKYYVGQNAERTANVLWEAHEKSERSNSLSNTWQISGQMHDREDDATSNESSSVNDPAVDE